MQMLISFGCYGLQYLLCSYVTRSLIRNLLVLEIRLLLDALVDLVYDCMDGV